MLPTTLHQSSSYRCVGRGIQDTGKRQSDMSRFVKNLKINNEIVTVSLMKEKFRPERHRFRTGADGNVYMDGVRGIGYDSTPADGNKIWDRYYRIVSFDVRWGHRQIKVPPRYYSSLLSKSTGFVDAESSYDMNESDIYLSVSEEKDALLMRVEGGDGAGSYRVTWIINRDGSIRFFTEGAP